MKRDQVFLNKYSLKLFTNFIKTILCKYSKTKKFINCPAMKMSRYVSGNTYDFIVGIYFQVAEYFLQESGYVTNFYGILEIEIKSIFMTLRH